MSLNQPTLQENLEQQKQIIHNYLNLLKKHEPNWTEPEQYSARHTRHNLKRQLKKLDELISYVKE